MVAGGVGGAVLASLRGLAADQLVEIALLAAGGFLLVQQREIGLVELLEELLPRDFLERVMLRVRRIGELDADAPGPAAFAVLLAVPPVVSRAHGRRAPAALLGPFADLVVVGRDL